MYVTSKTDIANLSLDLLSSEISINIDAPSNALESLVDRWYEHCRRLVLRSHPWNFATKRAVLSASATTPAFGLTQQFPVPADFIRLNSIYNASSSSPLANDLYKFENRNILTDSAESSQLNLNYVYDFTIVSQMDPLFVDLLAYEVALGIAYKITGGNTNVERIATLEKTRASLARSIDGQEDPPTVVFRSKSLAARRGFRGVDSSKVVF